MRLDVSPRQHEGGFGVACRTGLHQGHHEGALQDTIRRIRLGGLLLRITTVRWRSWLDVDKRDHPVRQMSFELVRV